MNTRRQFLAATAGGFCAFVAQASTRSTSRYAELEDFKLGERVELCPSNLDMSTNGYDRYYVARGEQIVDVWPIMGRSGAAQR